MARRLPAFLLLVILGCRIPNDREDLQLLDENKVRLNYPDLYLRARSQSNLALEAFYADDWADLEQAAKSLEQTAGLLPKSAGAPSEAKITEQLRADAAKLAEASKAKDVRVSNEALQRIQFNIRSLRPMVKDGASDGKAPKRVRSADCSYGRDTRWQRATCGPAAAMVPPGLIRFPGQQGLSPTWESQRLH